MALLAGAALALALGVYGREHVPTGRSIIGVPLERAIDVKTIVASAVIALAVIQLATGLRVHGVVRLPRRVPDWLGRAHRLTGAGAFALSVPVAYQCLWALGFQTYSTRVLVHSLAGCFFYGAFAAKVVLVESRRLPRWVLPVAGGALFAALTAIWLTSALWFFQNVGAPSL